MKIKLVMLSKKDCSLCNLGKRVVSAINRTYPEWETEIVDVEEESKYSAETAVNTIPVFLLYIDGQYMSKHNAAVRLETINRWINKYLK